MHEFIRLKNVKLSPTSTKQTDQDASKMNSDDEDNAPEMGMFNAEDSTMDNMENQDAEMFENELTEDLDCEMESSNITIPILPTKAGMNSITFLDLSSCGISSTGLGDIASSLEQNKVLTTLILRNNAIDKPLRRSTQIVTHTDTLNASAEVSNSSIASGFLTFANMLRINQTLKNIDLGHCQLQRKSIICLAGALKENKVLSALNLEGNPKAFSWSTGTQENSLLTLLCSIEQSYSLNILNLSNNDLEESLSGEEIYALANIITRLTTLHLCNVGLNGDHIMRLIAAIGDRSCALCVLKLARNRFVSEDGQHIGAFLNLCNNIKELNLDGNTKLDSDGLFSVLASLPNCSLSWLSCNGTAVVAASAIPSFVMQHLTYLSLSDIEVKSSNDLASWVSLLSECGGKIRFLSLWSRHLDMLLSLDTLKEMVKAMHSLLYGDFGVLLRFDVMEDQFHALEEMENLFSSRRAVSMATKL
ncbi:unnamed protein product [Phytomonas sp. Hart1]|nr:unnamed protein product [Phytomonas sp. Hart1]|eukprot:CCW70546.1 unnamed protein product [Phytomonas sp. isolate Hart1]